MRSPSSTFVPSSTYNSLPLISAVAGAPEEHAQELKELRELLDKHQVPKGVSIRLVHKHFDTKEGEVIIFDKIPVPEHAAVQIMKPTIPSPDNQLRGNTFLRRRGLIASGLRICQH
ncbi:hypothetical protein F5Y18DRAFT_392467 [Xylariaceae sp. FL1019]|nr:hypothetical protein F5Y18DRAFT_392467 [Xylariaceae sp. FL1019]